MSESGFWYWYVYVVRCNDGTLYTGSTTDVDRRISEHNSGNKGAKYTRSRRPVELIFCTAHGTRSSAQMVESSFKKLSRREKLDLVSEMEETFHLQNRGVQVGDLVCYKGNILIGVTLQPKDRIGVVTACSAVLGQNDLPQARVKFTDSWGAPDDIWIDCCRLLVYK